MILEGRRVVGADVTAIERVPAHRVALKPQASQMTSEVASSFGAETATAL